MTTHIKITDTNIAERSSITVTVYFRASGAASAPSTVHYRIDNLTTGSNITAWTSVTPGVSVDIPITSAENKIVGQSNVRERRQITVSADKGTNTETRDTAEWFVNNIGGWDEP